MIDQKTEQVLWMNRCLELAKAAAENGEVPVGALVIYQGQILVEASNLRETRQSPSAHAELLALEAASQKLGSWRLVDCTLVTTLEPCVMCAGALIQARIGRLIYGASDPKGGAESVFGLLSSQEHNHRLNFEAGVLAESCSEVLTAFFKKKREKQGPN